MEAFYALFYKNLSQIPRCIAAKRSCFPELLANWCLVLGRNTLYLAGLQAQPIVRHIGKVLIELKWEGKFSLPKSALDDAIELSRKYYQSKPELKRFIDRYKRKKTGCNPVGKRPNVYSPCPCGSGKKFKFCCYRKGIYD